MAYVAVTGGQKAIEQADLLIQKYRLQHAQHTLDIKTVEHQMRLLVDRVMSEGGLYAPEYAAIALKQAEGDPAEAAFLLRAYRSTLPRNHYSITADPGKARVIRRISSSFKDIPGGQMLGPTYDYTHRLLNFDLRGESTSDIQECLQQFGLSEEELEEVPVYKKVSDLLREQGYMQQVTDTPEQEVFDITREKLTFPTCRSARLQSLARGETGAMTALAYSSMRGYGPVHPTIGELRVGYMSIMIEHPYDKAPIYIGEILVTEVETINSFTQSKANQQVQFVLGYGFTFGQNEVKAISMAILERSLETAGSLPTQDEEFVLLHIDNVESCGFVSHLKLPHYITFQSSMDRIRQSQKHQQSVQEVEEGNKDELIVHT